MSALLKRPRLLMRLAEKGVRHVSQLGRYNYSSARPGLSDHTHLQAIEICFLVKGRQTYRVAGQDYRLIGGDVFVSFPGERHSTGGSPEEKGVLYWMVLHVPRREGEFLDLPPRQARALLRALRGLRPRHFRGSWKMKQHLDRLTELYHQWNSPLDSLAMSTKVCAFLLEVVAGARAKEKPARGRSLLPVFRLIAQHLDEPLPLSALAAEAGLSLPRFKARFKQETGVPPAEYVLRARIEEAERRLRAGRGSVTDIAYELGFSSSQYFATVFKRFTHRTPSGR